MENHSKMVPPYLRQSGICAAGSPAMPEQALRTQRNLYTLALMCRSSLAVAKIYRRSK